MPSKTIRPESRYLLLPVSSNDSSLQKLKKPKFEWSDVGYKLKSALKSVLRWSYWFAKELLKRVVVLGFHMLNVVITGGGFIGAASMLLCSVLAPICALLAWLATPVRVFFVPFVWFVGVLAFSIMHPYKYDDVLMPISIAVFTGAALLFDTWALLCFVGIEILFWCTQAEKSLADSFEPPEMEPSTSYIRQYSCAGGFCTVHLIPADILCANGTYFVIVKLFMGLLSAAVVIFTVVLPVVAIYSGGNVPLLGNLIMFEQSPVVFVGVISKSLGGRCFWAVQGGEAFRVADEKVRSPPNLLNWLSGR